MSKKKNEVIMTDGENKRKRSEIISDFVNLIKTSEQKYAFNFDEVHRCELLGSDLDHKLELQDLSYHEFARVAKQVRANQQERREYKDEVEELEPIKNWLTNNKVALNTIEKLLGEVRKSEEKHESRGYMPRVMTMEEWNHG
jgi:hypothetical protein